MKVGTDAMLLGAFAQGAEKSQLLDVGAGTGVLSLMMAQKIKHLHITAIEKDADAIIDLSFNLDNSIYTSDYEIVNCDFLEWTSIKKYDLILSNPPFYRDSFSATSMDKRSKARNENHLPLEQLLAKCSHFLAEDGQFWFIYPSMYYSQIMDFIFKSAWKIRKEIRVFGKPNVETRVIFCLQHYTTTKPEKINFLVRDEHGNYTDAYIALTKDFHNRSVVR